MDKKGGLMHYGKIAEAHGAGVKEYKCSDCQITFKADKGIEPDHCPMCQSEEILLKTK